MELIEYISNDEIALRLEQTIAEALAVFNDLSYTHLPVLKGEALLGSVAVEDLLLETEHKKTLEDVKYLFHYDFATEHDHFLDLISKFSNSNCNLLPVIKKNNIYLGYIDLSDVLSFFANSPFLTNDGFVLVLEKDTLEFTMSEVCQIVETNGNSLLGLYLTEQTREKTKITLRLNPIKINELIQLFRSYKYSVVNHLFEDSYLDDLKKRSEYFFKFINI